MAMNCVRFEIRERHLSSFSAKMEKLLFLVRARMPLTSETREEKASHREID